MVTGTLGELLVQTRLLQYGVQAAPPLKDSGNDMIAVRGIVFRAIQVKATAGDSYVVPSATRRYHLLAAVRLVGEDRNVWLDQSEIYLIPKSELAGTSRRFDDIPHLRLTPERIEQLFPGAVAVAAGDPGPEMERDRSHVINIPGSHPFERKEWRWTTFVGGFVQPVMRDREAMYWFTYYGDCARLRVRCREAEHQLIQEAIDQLMPKFGLSYRKNDAGEREELNYAMEGDIGGTRFLGAERADVTPTERGLHVLRMLHAGGQLFLNTLVKEGPYWREESCKGSNNPYDSSSRSYLHLLHNLTQSDIKVVSCHDKKGTPLVLCEYHYTHAVASGLVQHQEWPEFRLVV
jgi:hypothetical protein